VIEAYKTSESLDAERYFDNWMSNDFVAQLNYKGDENWSLGISISLIFISIDINSSSGFDWSIGRGKGLGASIYAEYDPNPYNKSGHVVGMSGYYGPGGGIYAETQSGDLRYRVGIGGGWFIPDVNFNPNQPK